MKKSIFVFLLVGALYGNAQDLVRFTGVILDTEDLDPVMGTAIFNQSRVAGAVSDSLGFFSIDALPGDTLLFSDVRYRNSTFIIPDILDESDYGIIQLLIKDQLVLEEVEVFSFPTEDQFRESFLSLDVGTTIESQEAEATRELMQTVKEAYENERYYYENWADRRLYQLTGKIPPNHLLDPIRWTNFIRDFKKSRE